MSKDTQQQDPYKILLIGETCLDVYNFGSIDRLSPEAPVPVLKKSRTEEKVGMSGNVLQNIQSMLPNAEIEVHTNNKEDIIKTRFIDQNSNYQIMRYDEESRLLPLKENIITKHDHYDAIVISDYDKGLVQASFVLNLMSKFSNSCKVFVDSKKVDLSCFKGALIKINEKENSLVDKDLKNDLDIIVTLGSSGCVYRQEKYPTRPVEVYDVCGAGDVFLSSLVARWLETRDMSRAIQTANNCASLSVTKMGCYTIKRVEYENLRV